MSDYNLGTAEGTIKIGYDGKGITQANTGMDDLEKRAKNVQSKFSSLATTSGIAFAAVAGGIGLAVNSAIDFEKRISAIGAVSGATSDQLEVIRKKALQLGADTAFSASEAASAMEELVKAGLSVDDVMNGAADATVALAAAGEVALPEAAAIASNAMNQFNLAASDLPRIADLIAGAANASAIDVGDFGMAMAQAGAVANLIGVNFEDLAAAIALMGNAGIKGSDAGTSLKTMLQNLQPTTTKQIELMKELGIVTADGSNKFFDQQGNLKSLADVAGVLNHALQGMTAGQKAMALETIFGTDAIRAAAVFANAGAEGFDNMADAMGKVTAQEVAAQRMNNVAGALEQLKGSLETVAIQFGTLLLPVIRKVTEFITELINKFSALDPKWQKLIAYAAVAVAGLLGLVTVVAAVIAAVAGIIATFAGLGEAGAIVFAVIAGVIALAVAIQQAYQRSAEFRDLLAKLGAVAQSVFKFIMAIVQPIIDFIRNDWIPAFKEIVSTLQRNLQPAFKAIGDFLEQRIVPAVDRLREAVSKVMPYVIGLAKFLLEVAKVVWNVLGKALGFIIPLLLKIIGPIFSVLINVIAWVIELIPTLIKAFKKFIDILMFVGKIIAIAVIAPFYLIYQVGKWVFEQVLKVASIFIKAFSAIWDFIAPLVKAVWDLVSAIIGLAFDIITALFQAWWTVVKAIWDAVWEYVVKPVIATFTAIWNVIKAAFAIILDIIAVAWAAIRAVWDKIYEWVVTPIVNAFNAVKEWINDRLEDVKRIASEAWDAIVKFFTDARDKIVRAVEGFTEFVSKIREHFASAKKAALDKLQELLDWVKELPGKIVSAIGDLGKTLYDSGKALIQGFWDGMKNIWNKMSGWVEDSMSWLRGLWPFSPAKHGPFSGKGWVLYSGRALMEGFAQGMAERTDNVRDAATTAMEMAARSLPTDYSATVSAATTGAGFAGGFSGGSAPAPSTTTTTTTTEVNINVPLEDLRSIRDVQDLLDFIDRLRNDSRRGLEVSVA